MRHTASACGWPTTTPATRTRRKTSPRTQCCAPGVAAQPFATAPGARSGWARSFATRPFAITRGFAPIRSTRSEQWEGAEDERIVSTVERADLHAARQAPQRARPEADRAALHRGSDPGGDRAAAGHPRRHGQGPPPPRPPPAPRRDGPHGHDLIAFPKAFPGRALARSGGSAAPSPACRALYIWAVGPGRTSDPCTSEFGPPEGTI